MAVPSSVLPHTFALLMDVSVAVQEVQSPPLNMTTLRSLVSSVLKEFVAAYESSTKKARFSLPHHPPLSLPTASFPPSSPGSTC